MDKLNIIFDKIKKGLASVKKLNPESFKKIHQFILEHKRYFGAGILFVALTLTIIFGAGKEGFFSGNWSASGDAAKFEKNKHKDVNELIKNYYVAYAQGDKEQLASYIEPMSYNESAYITLFSSYIEEIDVKNVYTKRGVEEGSYLVSVEMAIKFKGVDTPAPGLEFFYVETGKQDKLYINNIYSQFNMQVGEYVKDSAILAAIYEYEDCEEFKALQAAIEQEYTKAVAADEKLLEMVSSTISKAVSDWMSTIVIVLNQEPPQGNLAKDDVIAEEENSDETENDASVDDEDETDKEEDVEQGPQQEILDVTVVEQVVALYGTNVREKADKNSTLITTVEAGTAVEVVSIDAWGEWTRIKVGEFVGYIRNDLIKTVETEHSVAGQPAYPSVGQEVILLQDQDSYVTMNEEDTVIAKLKLGTTVKVEMSYANGWSKVSWDDGKKMGYVPTATLKLD